MYFYRDGGNSFDSLYQFDSAYVKLPYAGAELCSFSLSLDHGFHCPMDVSNISRSAFFRICATAA
jgi:hypothetical protein